MNVRKAKGQLRMDNQETLAALSAGRTKRHWQHCRQDEPRDTGSIVCRTKTNRQKHRTQKINKKSHRDPIK